MFRKKAKFGADVLHVPGHVLQSEDNDPPQMDHSSLPVIGLKGASDHFFLDHSNDDHLSRPEPVIFVTTTPVSIFVTNPTTTEQETTPRRTTATPRPTKTPRRPTTPLPRRPSPTTFSRTTAAFTTTFTTEFTTAATTFPIGVPVQVRTQFFRNYLKANLLATCKKPQSSLVLNS